MTRIGLTSALMSVRTPPATKAAVSDATVTLRIRYATAYMASEFAIQVRTSAMTGRITKDPGFRYEKNRKTISEVSAGVAKLADARDSKSRGVHPPCGFDSLLRHH